jgi:hypothetical protein
MSLTEMQVMKARWLAPAGFLSCRGLLNGAANSSIGQEFAALR